MKNLGARLLLVFALGLCTACSARLSPGTQPVASATQDVIGQIVEATLAAMTAQARPAPSRPSSPSPSPATAVGSIAGSLSYPADSIPAMYVVAYRVGSSHYESITTAAGQGTYEIHNVAAGTYHVIAYTVGGGGFPAGFAGGYTRAVLCGLATECADHTLVDVVVPAGASVSQIDVRDWYAPAGTFPPFPGQAPVATATLAADTGGVSGDLMYPASGLPALRIVAFAVSSGAYYYTETTAGQSKYELDNLPPSTYHVVAYVIPGGGFTGGPPGGYSQMVPCGLKSGCNDHTLIDVLVTSGHVTTGVNPNDYYADSGTFPPDPVP